MGLENFEGAKNFRDYQSFYVLVRGWVVGVLQGASAGGLGTVVVVGEHARGLSGRLGLGTSRGDVWSLSTFNVSINDSSKP